MKLRYLVLVTFVAASLAACGQSPTAPTAVRSTEQVMLDGGTGTETATPGTGAAGSGH